MTRRARLAGVFVESVSALKVFDIYEGFCGICGYAVDPANFHVDHIHPITEGGLHSYANSQLAHPLCNLWKGSRVLDWSGCSSPWG